MQDAPITELTELVLPAQANHYGTLFAGQALSMLAQAAFTAAMYYAPTNAKATVAADVSDRTVVKAMDKVIPVDWIGLSKVRDQITQDWRRKVIPLSR